MIPTDKPTRIRPIAEYTQALTLASLTQIANYHHYMRSGEAWSRAKFGRTRILHNRRVGVVEFGLIGKGIADLFNLNSAGNSWQKKWNAFRRANARIPPSAPSGRWR